jgi:acid stress chaperone HdeB
MSVKYAWWGSMVFGVLVGSAAYAQTTIDVAKISCEQFVTMKVVSPDYLAIWLSGYYNGKRDNTKIDIQQLKANADKIKRFCLYYKGSISLMDAVEQQLSPNK